MITKKSPHDFRLLMKRRGRTQIPLITKLEDKWAVRDYVKAFNIPLPKLIQYGKTIEDIDFNKLPESYVLKPTHLGVSRGVYCVKEGHELLKNRSLKEKSIKKDFKKLFNKGWKHEKSVSIIPPGVIVEELLPAESDAFDLLPDLKCYVFGGEVKYMLYMFKARGKLSYKSHYTRDWQQVQLKEKENHYPVDAPQCLDDIIQYAEILAKEIKTFCRIDFYPTKKGAVFGEFTFHPSAGDGFSKERVSDSLCK